MINFISMQRSLLTTMFVSMLPLSFAGRALAENEEFTYRVKSYPAVGNCHEIASQLGARFAEQTAITPIESRCVDINSFGYDIDIVYAAAKELNPVTTAPSYVPYGVSAASFASQVACEEQLPAEQALFVERTSLAPLLSYCYREKLTDRDPWAARIEAFGDAAVAPYLTGASMMEVPSSTDLAGIRDEITSHLGSRGVEVRFLKIRSSGPGQGVLSLLYYAAKPFKLQLKQQAHVSRREECQEQLELARPIFAGAPSAPLSMYCAVGGYSGSHYLMAFYQDGSGLRVIDAPEHYDTYQVCMESRSAVLADYQRRMPAKVMGALCSHREFDVPLDPTLRVRVILKP